MITYASFKNLRPELLGTAAESWGEAAAALRQAGETAQNGVRKKALAGEWSGEAADTGRKALARAVDRVGHGRDHAQTVHDLLKELHEKLTDCRRRLNAIEDEARERGVTITPEGRVTADPLPPGSEAWDPGAVEAWGPSDEEVARIATDIGRVLEEAAGYDTAASHALNELTEGERAFQPVGGASDNLDAAEQDLYTDAAGEAVTLAQKEELTEAEVIRLDRYLEQYGDNEYFAEPFAIGMGAAGVLDFWTGPPPAGVSTETLDSLAENFGSTLGVATQVDSREMRQWEDEMVQLGDEPLTAVGPGYPATGFQVMSHLMAQGGEYGEDFMLQYGAALEEADQRRGEPWSYAPSHLDTVLGEDLTLDPATGYMEALSRTPDVSTAFFLEDRQRVDYFMDERIQPGGAGFAEGENAEPLVRATGDALIAGSTGVNPRDPLAERPEEYTPDQESLRDRVVATAAGSGDDLHPSFRTPMAQLLGYHSEYVYDNTGLVSSSADQQHLAALALQIARDPEAYGVINGAMAHEYANQVRADDRIEGGRDPIESAVISIGFFEEARKEALELYREDSEWQAKNAYNLLGAGIGSIPVVGNAANHALDQMTGRWGREAVEIEVDDIKEERLELSMESIEYMEYLVGVHLEARGMEIRDTGWEGAKETLVADMNGLRNDGKEMFKDHG